MKVLVADTLAKEGLELLKKETELTYDEKITPEALKEKVKDFDALLVRGRTKVTKEVIEAGKNLKAIGRAGIGVDNIDVKAATARKIPVVNAPRSSTISVAEQAMGLMLCLARDIPRADHTMKEGKWEKKGFEGVELNGKTLGFIGIGRIGYEVGVRAKAFGMKLIAYDPYIKQEILDPIGCKLVKTLDEVLAVADYITIHSLLTDETRGMVGKAQFDKMKKGVRIVNCARGPIIQEKALVEAIKAGKVAGAGLDVFENEPPGASELVKLPNVVCTPHIAANTQEAQVSAGITTAEQIIKVLKGSKPDFVVNFEIYK
jgi:D-3-phosphoglycerate dehydrogenase